MNINYDFFLKTIRSFLKVKILFLILILIPNISYSENFCLKFLKESLKKSNALSYVKTLKLDHPLNNFIEIHEYLKNNYNIRSFKRINKNTLKELEHVDTKSSANRLEKININQIKKIYSAVSLNKVASLNAIDKYDPRGDIGYCFGRATAAHLQLLSSGVSKNSIRKVWAIGTFDAGNNTWRYHVSTIVKGDNNKWYTIDPIFDEPLELSEWIKEMQKYNLATKDMIILSTEAKKFAPGTGGYSKSHLNSFKEYFDDLFTTFRENNSNPNRIKFNLNNKSK